jgi:hypothetical protein
VVGAVMKFVEINDPVAFWTLVSATAALFAALYGFVFAIFTQAARLKADTARFFIDFSDRYNSPEVYKAMHTLRKFAEKFGDDFPNVYAKYYQSKNDEYLEIDSARRVINRYFTNVAEMRFNGLISKSLAKMLLAHHGLNLYYAIVVPMNLIKYGDIPENRRIVSGLREISKSYGNGVWKSPISMPQSTQI